MKLHRGSKDSYSKKKKINGKKRTITIKQYSMKATVLLLLFIRIKYITLQSKSLPDFTPWRQQRGHKIMQIVLSL